MASHSESRPAQDVPSSPQGDIRPSSLSQAGEIMASFLLQSSLGDDGPSSPVACSRVVPSCLRCQGR